MISMREDDKIIQFKLSAIPEIKSYETEILLNPALAPKTGRQMYEIGRVIANQPVIEWVDA